MAMKGDTKMPEENDIPVQTDTDASPAVTPEPHYTFGNNGTGGTTPLYPGSYDIIGALTGRREIVTAARVINQSNIIDELRKAVEVHDRNSREISFLWDYYCGKQPILHRVKDVRPEICAKIVENHADEVVSFKTGYNFGEPYVLAGRSEDDCSEAIQQLNAWNAENDHDAKDVELGTWMFVAGTAYKMVFPTGEVEEDTSELSSPYMVSVLDPRDTFVVYYNGVQKIPVMGVKAVTVGNTHTSADTLYCVYTENEYYEISKQVVDGGQGTVFPKRNHLGMIPIVEYPLGFARRGAIEPILGLCDALNALASNRLDGVEQFVQSIMIFRNVDMDSTDVERLQQLGAIKYRDVDPQTPGEVRYLVAELNQEGTQTLKDDLYESIVTISGLPNRNGGNSTSDNVGAVIYRDGWSAAETKAKEVDKYYQRAEKNLLKVILRICRETNRFDVHLSNIEIKPTRKNYENTQAKATVLTQMLGCEKIAPRLAFNACGMFTDPEAAWKESDGHYQEFLKQEKQTSKNTGRDTGTGNTGTAGSS